MNPNPSFHRLLKCLPLFLVILFLSACEPAPTPPNAPPKITGLPTTAGSFSTAKQWLYEKVGPVNFPVMNGGRCAKPDS